MVSSWTYELLALDPWRESTYRQLMLLYAQSGRVAAALEQYENCRRILDEELGVGAVAGDNRALRTTA